MNNLHSLGPVVDVGGEAKSLWMHTASKEPELQHQFFLRDKLSQICVLEYLRHSFEEFEAAAASSTFK